MAVTEETITYLVEQMSAASVSAKKMFGGYCLYCDDKVVALVCDNQLFVKPTKAGRAYIGVCDEQPPYQGAKPYFFISGEKWDDHEWLSVLIRMTAAELPLPKKKK